MTTKVIKRTIEEVTDANETVTETVKAIEIAIIDGENEVGRINVNEWGGSYNYNQLDVDVEAVGMAIYDILNPVTE